MPRPEFSIITEIGAAPQPQELEVAKLIIKYDNVKFLRVGRRYKESTPDIFWLGEFWEIKHLIKFGKYTIRDLFRRASVQSPNVIVCLSRTKKGEIQIIRAIEKEFQEKKAIKKLAIITKGREVRFYDKTLDAKRNKI